MNPVDKTLTLPPLVLIYTGRIGLKNYFTPAVGLLLLWSNHQTMQRTKFQTAAEIEPTPFCLPGERLDHKQVHYRSRYIMQRCQIPQKRKFLCLQVKLRIQNFTVGILGSSKARYRHGQRLSRSPGHFGDCNVCDGPQALVNLSYKLLILPGT